MAILNDQKIPFSWKCLASLHNVVEEKEDALGISLVEDPQIPQVLFLLVQCPKSIWGFSCFQAHTLHVNPQNVCLNNSLALFYTIYNFKLKSLNCCTFLRSWPILG